ncbi:MAG TPA: hypothetical protein VMO81_11175 [Aestuariivirgaceae bacterium]|nr:hypothetical protein [Aestuariivirgaceae bacterium]
MIQELLAAYEASALGHGARNSVWLYPLANLVHVLGASLLVGGIAVFDILVLRRRYQTASNAGRIAIPLAATGLALQASSGLVLFSAEATTIARNPAFLFKMTMLVVGLANVAAFHAWHRVSELAEESHGPAVRLGAIVSLGVWILVLLAGRAIAYG